MKKRILISACLLGEKCRYDGSEKTSAPAVEIAARFSAIPVCPEVLGGLPIPRQPGERSGGRVLGKDGTDVTREYRDGAEKTLALAREMGCERAILKCGSPSCGCGWIYDGSFSGKRIPGDGVTCELLRQNGVECVSSEDEARMKAMLAE